MRKNYLTSAYSAQVMLKMWMEDDKESQNRSQQTPIHKVRQIVFVSSAAAFVGFLVILLIQVCPSQYHSSIT